MNTLQIDYKRVCLVLLIMFIMMVKFVNCTPNLASGKSITQSEHYWVKGPYFIVAAKNAEEASHKKPTQYIQVEYDSQSGIIRLSEIDRNARGTDLGE